MSVDDTASVLGGEIAGPEMMEQAAGALAAGSTPDQMLAMFGQAGLSPAEEAKMERWARQEPAWLPNQLTGEAAACGKASLLPLTHYLRDSRINIDPAKATPEQLRDVVEWLERRSVLPDRGLAAGGREGTGPALFTTAFVAGRERILHTEWVAYLVENPPSERICVRLPARSLGRQGLGGIVRPAAGGAAAAVAATRTTAAGVPAAKKVQVDWLQMSGDAAAGGEVATATAAAAGAAGCCCRFCLAAAAGTAAGAAAAGEEDAAAAAAAAAAATAAAAVAVAVAEAQECDVSE